MALSPRRVPITPRPVTRTSAFRPAAFLALALVTTLASLLATAGASAARPDDGFVDRFERFPAGQLWAEGTSHGRWQTVFDGYGRVSIETTGSRVVHAAPATASSPGETHAALVTSRETFGDLDLSARMLTTRQLRRGSSPHAWETAWLLWHYTDNTHFYYLILKPNGWELGKEDPAYPGHQRFLATGENRKFPVGSWYSASVRQEGGVIEISVDGKPLLRFVDRERPYLSGRIGLYTEDAAVAFDDVIVTPT